MLRGLDLAILEALYAGRLSRAWVEAIAFVSFLGSGWMLLVLLFAIATRALRGPAFAALVMLVTLSGIVASAKAIIGRVRPCYAYAFAHALPIAFPSDCSFPSGHAAGSFAFVAFVWALDRRTGMWLLPLAGSIAVSRVMLGVHYPSDVLAGAALGAVAGRFGARCYRLASAVSPTQIPNPSGTERLPP